LLAKSGSLHPRSRLPLGREALFLRLRRRYPLPWGEGFEPYERSELGEKGQGLRPVHLARRLRRDMTEAERKLWSRLRSGQLGVKFRRQVPIDRYIADFACIEARLVVEVDGGQHNIDIASDRARTAVLETAGYLVIRFWNYEVLKDIDGVVERIAGTLAAGTSSGD